ncbi:transposase family protein [Vulcanococcus limneticus]|uniref:transposase family protein n=1 Tax=Vulcanococcus limneticus TaxID=2170428 RepID=UPI00398C2379
MPKSVSSATDLDLISYLKAVPDARMRRGVRIPAWYLLLVAVLGILSKCERLRDLEHFARRHHSVLTEGLGLDLRRPPSDSAFRYFFLQVDVAAVCAAIRDWTMAQACYATGENHERAVLKKLLGELDLEGVLIQADAPHTQRPFLDSSRSRGPTSC